MRRASRMASSWRGVESLIDGGARRGTHGSDSELKFIYNFYDQTNSFIFQHDTLTSKSKGAHRSLPTD